MAQLNKRCLACGAKFTHCPDCSRVDALKPTWASQFCSEPCATLWTTLSKFSMSMLSKSEAKLIVSELDLKPIDVYVACVQRDYAKVMAEEKKPKRGKRFEMNIFDETMGIKPEVVKHIVEEKIEQTVEVAETVAAKASHEVVIEKENK